MHRAHAHAPRMHAPRTHARTARTHRAHAVAGAVLPARHAPLRSAQPACDRGLRGHRACGRPHPLAVLPAQPRAAIGTRRPVRLAAPGGAARGVVRAPGLAVWACAARIGGDVGRSTRLVGQAYHSLGEACLELGVMLMGRRLKRVPLPVTQSASPKAQRRGEAITL
eukprot:3783631-Prymnesium_polylepis.1